jgi:large subunit ribosomal protein L4
MAIKAKVYNQEGAAAGEMELAESVFGIEAKEALIHQAVTAQMGNQRQVLAHTKDRSEVRGGGRKPWRQKGTGRARAGSNRSPIWIGGGVTFGPSKERNFSKKLNRKMKQKALCAVLSDKIKNRQLVIVDKFRAEDFKTKVMDAALAKLEKNAWDRKENVRRNVLVIIDEKDDKVSRSFRNLEGVGVINLSNINILDLLAYRDAVLTKKSIEKLSEKYAV